MMTDRSHLDAIDLRLSHERERVRTAKTANEREWREHNVRMIERERENEIAFLAKHGIVVEEAPAMTQAELMAELDEIGKELGL